MTIVFRQESFRTKDALKERLRGLVQRMPLGQTLAGEHLEVALGVLDIHPRGSEKIGPGVEAIELRAGKFGNRVFWLLRSDGTWTDFSWAKCMDGRRPDRFYQHQAMRQAIRGQILAFRQHLFGEGPVRCAITGDQLVNDQTTHVDHHAPTFRELADRFVALDGPVIWHDPRDSHTSAQMSDADQRSRWERFHEENAVLRAVTRHANLTRPRADTAA